MPKEGKSIICPLKFTGKLQHPLLIQCDKGKCAWWCEYNRSCAILTIAGILADSTICQNSFYSAEGEPGA